MSGQLMGCRAERSLKLNGNISDIISGSVLSDSCMKLECEVNPCMVILNLGEGIGAYESIGKRITKIQCRHT